MYNDEEWLNRFWAIRVFEKIEDKAVIPHLKKVLMNKNEHEKVRKAAQEAIEKLSK